VYEQTGTAGGQLYTILTDHLGSITEVISPSGTVAKQSFDAWGNPRKSGDWTEEADYDLFTDRGFTGHEHLEEFFLVDMNGRVYDPVLGRFLGVDPHVQAPGFSQNFNRYSYCLNNPLIYTDPDGEWIELLISGLIGGVSNLITNWRNIDNFVEGLTTFGAGAASSILTTINPILGAALGEALRQGSNNIIEQTNESIKLRGVDWNSFGNRTLYGLGAGLATGIVSKDIFIPIGKNIEFELNLTSATHRFASVQNHIIRSTAYHMGGNLFSGKKPFDNFDNHFFGIDGSLAVPVLMDSFRFYADKSGWSEKRIMNKTDVITNDYNNFFQETGTNIEYQINGPYNSTLNFNSDGYLKVSGTFISVNEMSIFNRIIPVSKNYTVTWNSLINFRFLFTLFYK